MFFGNLFNFDQASQRFRRMWIRNLHAEEVDGVGDMGLGDSTMVNAETFLGVFF